MGFGRYNKTLALIFAPPLIVIVIITLFAEPVTGDLTRLGGHFEEQFGWREPQQAVARSRFKLAQSLHDYDRYYDVVVLGDSFSADNDKGWQNWFYEQTGLTIISFTMAKPKGEASTSSGLDIESVVGSAQFKSHPPRYFIFESVERNVVSNLSLYASKALAGEHSIEGLGRASLTVPRTVNLQRKSIERSNSLGAELRIQQAVNIVTKTFIRFFGRDEKTRIYDLNTNNLFSNRLSDRLLVLADDAKKELSKEGFNHAIDGLRAAQAYVERNRSTHFMVLLFPDKLSVYADYLKNSYDGIPSYLPLLSEKYQFPQLLPVYKKALENGVRDLYLPNDTHAGYFGHRLAAEVLINFYLSLDKVPYRE